MERPAAVDVYKRQVYNKSTETICAGCGMSAVCWRKHKEQTLQNFASFSVVLKERGKVESSDFSKEFADRCGRVGEMRDAINKNYNRYLMKEAAELRTAQVREVVEEHFRTTAGILEEMAGEFSLYEHFDEEAAQRVEDILRDNGVTPLEVCCRIDKFDRMTIEAEVGKDRQKRINRATFTREISAACGRSFSPPCVSVAEDKCRIQMCQRPSFEAVSYTHLDVYKRQAIILPLWHTPSCIRIPRRDTSFALPREEVATMPSQQRR